MGKNSNKVDPRGNSGATRPGFTVTGRNMAGLQAQTTPKNRGKGAKKR